ncbi:Low-density lipoprotein receptor domain class A [Necator americanus]|uniref:Low-density lipoprotein receptor domain class A n=1 Tax=Necator americanus TaxID=51031 RepID=W2T8L3_NECAM|nr:Low-density lipoprotein receptor domain class A [Necator americanus]ETN77312.1 Low-density lipoprotein receptor domain class A [Necator americanus]
MGERDVSLNGLGQGSGHAGWRKRPIKDTSKLTADCGAVAVRLPGRCLPGDFDCGFGRCVPVKVFHDGKPDCYDGSDEC